MNWFRNFALCLGLLGLASGNLQAAAKDDVPVKAGKTGKKAKDKKASAADGTGKKEDASSTESDGGRMTVPIPPGHDAKKLVIPYRDEDGVMQTRFTMDLGKRTDPDHMEMSQLLIETFDRGKPEMTIDLPESMLDLKTRIITTKSGVVIKRADFELSGQTMEFNTESKVGKLGGKVRMLIYNLEK